MGTKKLTEDTKMINILKAFLPFGKMKAIEPKTIEVKKPMFSVGDEVLVFDRYRFAIPLKAKIIRFSEVNDGVEIELLQTNNHQYPIGHKAWFHAQQLKSLVLNGN